jgi:DNA-binding response OmpR family regulator
MSLQLVWVIAPALPDNTKANELSLLLDILAEESIVECQHISSLHQAVQQLPIDLPDLILIVADPLEAQDESVTLFCQELRELGMIYRPVVVIQTSTDDAERRIDYLISGADDTLSTTLSVEEIRIRALVHLRRNLDVLSNRLTRLPGRNLSSKTLQRRINRQEEWGELLLSVAHWDEYVEVYGHSHGEQVLKTVASMLSTIIFPPDFVGHPEANQFLILTQANQAEKLATHLCRQFDAVSPNFYSPADRQRGYIVSVQNERVSRRVRFLSLAIGIVTKDTHASIESYQTAYTLATQMARLALANNVVQSGSHWLSERLKLTNTTLSKPNSTTSPQTTIKKSILVVESDAAMAYLLKATLEMQGYTIETACNPEMAHAELATQQALGHSVPLVLLDSLLNGEASGWALCRTIKQRSPHTAVICLSTLDDREQAMNAGADLYLPKPFELMPLFTWVDKLMKG